MVQLSLGCKQLSSDVNKIASSLLESLSIGFVRRPDEECTTTTVFQDLNELRMRSSDELWVGNKTYNESKEWLETHCGMKFGNYVKKKKPVEKNNDNSNINNTRTRIPADLFFSDTEDEEEDS